MIAEEGKEEKEKEEKVEVVVGKKTETSEAEEVREILEAVTPFLEKLKDMSKELIVAVTASLDGKKLGEEVASLYKELKESGLPEDLIKEMVKEFYKKKLEIAPSINEVLKSIAETIKSEKAKIVIGGKKVIGEKEEEEQEEEEKEEKE